MMRTNRSRNDPTNLPARTGVTDLNTRGLNHVSRLNVKLIPRDSDSAYVKRQSNVRNSVTTLFYSPVFTNTLNLIKLVELFVCVCLRWHLITFTKITLMNLIYHNVGKIISVGVYYKCVCVCARAESSETRGASLIWLESVTFVSDKKTV